MLSPCSSAYAFLEARQGSAFDTKEPPMSKRRNSAWRAAIYLDSFVEPAILLFEGEASVGEGR